MAKARGSARAERRAQQAVYEIVVVFRAESIFEALGVRRRIGVMKIKGATIDEAIAKAKQRPGVTAAEALTPELATHLQGECDCVTGAVDSWSKFHV